MAFNLLLPSIQPDPRLRWNFIASVLKIALGRLDGSKGCYDTKNLVQTTGHYNTYPYHFYTVNFLFHFLRFVTEVRSC